MEIIRDKVINNGVFILIAILLGFILFNIDSTLAEYKEPHTVKCYSGGVIIYETKFKGPPENLRKLNSHFIVDGVVLPNTCIIQ